MIRGFDLYYMSMTTKLPFGCGGLTRTDDLWVMSPTSYQLLHSAVLGSFSVSGLLVAEA